MSRLYRILGLDALGEFVLRYPPAERVARRCVEVLNAWLVARAERRSR